MNVLIFPAEMEEALAYVDALDAAGVDAVIAADLSVISYAHSIGLEVHISVQANVCNMGAVRFFAAYADVMVLAREVPLGTVQRITEAIRKDQKQSDTKDGADECL